jgi:hypothetical protein
MTRRVESSRRHGPFDTRGRSNRPIVSDERQAENARTDGAVIGLDWSEFSRRYFAARRPHDFARLRAFARYRKR